MSSTFFLRDLTSGDDHFDIGTVTKSRERLGGDTFCTITLTRPFRDLRGLQDSSELDVYFDGNVIFKGELFDIQTTGTGDTGTVTIVLENKALKAMRQHFPRGWFNGGGKEIATGTPYARFVDTEDEDKLKDFWYVFWSTAAIFAGQISLGGKQADRAATVETLVPIPMRNIIDILLQVYSISYNRNQWLSARRGDWPHEIENSDGGFTDVNIFNAIAALQFDGNTNLWDVLKSLSESFGIPTSMGFVDDSTEFYIKNVDNGTERTFRTARDTSNPFIAMGNISERRDYSNLLRSVTVMGGGTGIGRSFAYFNTSSTVTTGGRHRTIFMPTVIDLTTAQQIAQGVLTEYDHARTNHSFTVENSPDVQSFDKIKIQTLEATFATEMTSSISFEYTKAVRRARITTGNMPRTISEIVDEATQRATIAGSRSTNDTVGPDMQHTIQLFKVITDEGSNIYTIKMVDESGSTSYQDPESNFTFKNVAVTVSHGQALLVGSNVSGILRRGRDSLTLQVLNGTFVDF